MSAHKTHFKRKLRQIILSLLLTGFIIPSNIGDLSSIKWLRLDNNNLHGEIPESIGDMTNLEKLYLLSNDLSGEIPQSLCNLTNLWNVQLHNNQLCQGDNGWPVCATVNWGINQQNCP